MARQTGSYPLRQRPIIVGIAAVRLDEGKRGVERERIDVSRQAREVDRLRQQVGLGRLVDLPIRKDDRHHARTKAVVSQPGQIPLHRTHAPEVRVQGRGYPLEPRFVVQILALEMLWT
jgi:hypothetical protein